MGHTNEPTFFFSERSHFVVGFVKNDSKPNTVPRYIIWTFTRFVSFETIPFQVWFWKELQARVLIKETFNFQEKKFKCHICKLSFGRELRLRSHLVRHSVGVFRSQHQSNALKFLILSFVFEEWSTIRLRSVCKKIQTSLQFEKAFILVS